MRIKDANRLAVIRVVFEQQETMYKEKKNSIPNRIVSLSQPYIRPIVRGKAKTPTEFGAKIDMSIDENGMARLEKMSFDAYNESDVLIGAIERYYERWKHYPEKVLVDQIYRTRKNLAFAKNMASDYPVLHLAVPGKILPPRLKQSIRMLLPESRSRGDSV